MTGNFQDIHDQIKEKDAMIRQFDQLYEKIKQDFKGERDLREIKEK